MTSFEFERKIIFHIHTTFFIFYLTFLHPQLEETRKELNESQAKAIKLASNEEWNTERFKIAQKSLKLKKLKLEVSY